MALAFEPNQQQIERLLNSIRDFEIASSSLKFLLDECEFDDQASRNEKRRFVIYESMAIVSFSRPFLNCEGGSALSFELIGFEFEEGEKPLFDMIVAIRQQIVSYEGAALDFHLTELAPFEDQPDIMTPIPKFEDSLNLSERDLRKFDVLVRRISRCVVTTLFNVSKERPELLSRYE